MADEDQIPPVAAEPAIEEPAPAESEPAPKAPWGSKGRKHDSKYDPTPQKKRRLTFGMKMALLQIIERKQLSDRVGYKEVAARCGVSVMALKQVMVQYRKGLVDLGQPETPEEVALDARNQHERTLNLIARSQLLFMDQLEHQLISADRSQKKKKLPAGPLKAIPGIIRNLASIIQLKHRQEEGYNALLSEMMERRRREEKQAGLPKDTATQIVAANDAQKAIAALTGTTKLPEDSEIDPPHADPQTEQEEYENFLNGRGA